MIPTVPTRLDLIRNLGGHLTGAEVGVMNGDFSAEILSLDNIRHLYLIDPWMHQPDGPYKDDPANVDQGGQDERYCFVETRFECDRRSEIIRMFSVDAAIHLKTAGLNFVYLDAAHDFDSVLADLRAWSKIAPVLFVHDFVENESADTMGFGVIRAVTAFCLESGWRVTALTEHDEWPTCELRKA